MTAFKSTEPTTRQSKTVQDKTDQDKTERLDEALACVRKYGRQNAADTRAIETAIRSVRSRIAARTRELEPAEA